ncbi:uncharacterized protein J3D65DRAFT_476699 [Phyllosticta citribraziliensis]|uniref:N-acetylgalactosaminide beta-1,3-galactosyltransferase n=1 Tax=Phyllosticta citribraziliensis TaxID=989973 RepID=A0ABR1LG72_9PEZI
MSSPSFLPRHRARVFVFAIAVLFFFCVLRTQFANTERPDASEALELEDSEETTDSGSHLPCRALPGAKDVLVVLKTGATEASEKLPVHFNTTFSCTPHYVLFSDLEQDIQGHVVHDVLNETDPSLREEHNDFELYRQLRKWSEDGFPDFEKDWDTHKSAWNLDKYKFLPLMKKALQTRPSAKWFVFIEADTYLVWSNLLSFLQQFDHHKPLYIGGQSYIRGTWFAHGGTGFVVSNKAMNMIVAEYTSKTERYNQLTKMEWAGDFVLAKAFKNIDIPLTKSWPRLQGETPYTLDYTEHHFCYPVVSYHHMPPEWIEKMWDYEQAWLNNNESSTSPICHHHIFKHFIAPELVVEQRQDWDNMAGDAEPEAVQSAEACRQVCESQSDCLTWAYVDPAWTCKTANVVRLGEEKPSDGSQTTTSGWMLSRIRDAVASMDAQCKGDGSEKFALS